MFLKRIDVFGFKSFADKTKLEFSPGITAVVGPNGSGKSNIADAIRWVLGEQSARSLRGTKMEDVIFAGSDSRRSVNFCEVSLTLDNLDRHLPVVYDEVTVTRRVYRSGESEYMINKQSCRLKDITELFMDSGLGRESYSIIGQGKIEEMLSTRPEDRRGPFEDAAGIVKFKFRRKEAERKLEETEANLLRVDDILAELSRQAGPLEAEAQRAKEFKVLREELTNHEISLLVAEIQSLQGRWNSLAQVVEQLKSERERVQQQVLSAEEDLKRARKQFEWQNEASENLQKQLMLSVEERQRLEGNVLLLEERAKNSELQVRDKHRQSSEIHDEVYLLQTEQTELENRIRELTAELSLRQADLEASAADVDPAARSRLESNIDQLNSDLIEVHHEAATLRNELKVAQESAVHEEKQRDRLSQERNRYEQEAARLDEAAKSLQAELQQHQNRQHDSQSRLNEQSVHLREFTEQEASCVASLNQIQSQMASLKSRAELLKDLEEGYDGYALGVRTVLQAGAKGRLHGIHGSLASLLSVPKRYETATEIALGATLQNVVVDSEADARAAIEMLKSRQAGRATFMPLSVIRSRLLSQHEVAKVRSHHGFVGVASELVQVESQYQNLVEHVLGNVIVAEKLIDANELAKLLGYRVRIVTLDGDVVSPGGVMSGGSHQRKGPGLLGRTRERQEIQSRLEELDRQQSDWKKQQAELREKIEGIHQDQRRVMQELEQERKGIALVETQIKENETRRQGVMERLGGLEWEFNQLEQGRTAWESRAQQAHNRLAEVEEKLKFIEGELVSGRKRLEEWDRTVASAQERLTLLKVEVATQTQELSAARQRLSDFERRISRHQAQKSQLEQEIAGLEKAIGQTQEEIKQAQEKLAQVSLSVQELDDRLLSVREERRQAEAEVVSADKAFREQQQALTAVEEQLHRQEVAAERTDLELNHALQRMGESYHMTYEWAHEHFPAPESLDEVRRTVDRLKRQMAQMGDVNLSAIDEWARLSERIEFLAKEQADLRLAESQLQDVIAEIDDEMARRFAETFEQIRVEFQSAFRHLFNGGRADLELTNPENLLRTGIEVIAQPPGKRLQNLNLMSGGERALTAMALLFAILRVRPVPFCVLDEVEAALDEANVGRFAQHVRRFADDTQFIVITHRRGTMEEADVLYGVTMQESGVSSLIAVRLADESGFESA